MAELKAKYTLLHDTVVRYALCSEETPFIVSVFLPYNRWDLSAFVFPPNVETGAKVRVQAVLETTGEDVVNV